jgi:hypothetical protein
MDRRMSLVSKIARFATSPKGRRAIEEARTKLDTPENRQRVTDALGKVRGRGEGRSGQQQSGR